MVVTGSSDHASELTAHELHVALLRRRGRDEPGRGSSPLSEPRDDRLPPTEHLPEVRSALANRARPPNREGARRPALEWVARRACQVAAVLLTHEQSGEPQSGIPPLAAWDLIRLTSVVLTTDNAPRVRDGYISRGTRGYARARETRLERSISRRNVTASARPCLPVPPLNLHGKEGVNGSSPLEGFVRNPANGSFCCLPRRSASVSRVRDGYIFGRPGTRGHARPYATNATTSFAREWGVTSQRCAQRIMPANRRFVGTRQHSSALTPANG